MSEALRGFVLLLSVLLWLPALRPFLDGQLSAEEAALRYAGALLLSWGGVSLLAAIVKAYTPAPQRDEQPAPTSSSATAKTAAQPAAAERSPSRSPNGDPAGRVDAPADAVPDGTPRRRTEDLAR